MRLNSRKPIRLSSPVLLKPTAIARIPTNEQDGIIHECLGDHLGREDVEDVHQDCDQYNGAALSAMLRLPIGEQPPGVCLS